jgi:chromosomal replication initiator protein
LTIQQIQEAVAQHYGLKIRQLVGPHQHRGISRPRMLAMYLCRTMTPSSLPAIGRAFGGRHHTTVLNACRTMVGLIERDVNLLLIRDTITFRLRSEEEESDVRLA